MKDLDDATLQEIASEIVREIYDPEAIAKRFQITLGDLDALKRTRRFQIMLAEAAITWDSSINTRERLKIKGDVIVEQMMIRAFQYYTSEAHPLAARVKLMETVAKISGAYSEGTRVPGVIAGADVGRPSDKVNITINLHPSTQNAGQIVIDQQRLQLPAHDVE